MYVHLPSRMKALLIKQDGPVFYDYFLDQNQAIANGSSHGYHLNFETLGVGTLHAGRVYKLMRSRSEMASLIITSKRRTIQDLPSRTRTGLFRSIKLCMTS